MPPMTSDDEIGAIDAAITHLESELRTRPPSEERCKSMRVVIQTLHTMRANLRERKQLKLA